MDLGMIRQEEDAMLAAGQKRPANAMGGGRSFFTWFNDNMDASCDDLAEVSLEPPILH